MSRTQKNKKTEYHLGRLKARLAKLRTELQEGGSKGAGEGDGFDVKRYGDTRVALIGFPSVGKSTLLTQLTGTESEAAAYEVDREPHTKSSAHVSSTLPPSLNTPCHPHNHHAPQFTTLTCIPGVIHYNDSKIQLLDLPGIIEGAAEGRGRGRQVIACAKSSDLILMVLDATKPWTHKEILTRELEAMGIRLNKRPPNVYFRKKKAGGLQFTA